MSTGKQMHEPSAAEGDTRVKYPPELPVRQTLLHFAPLDQPVCTTTLLFPGYRIASCLTCFAGCRRLCAIHPAALRKLAYVRWSLRPGTFVECVRSSLHSGVDILRAPFVHLEDRFFRAWVNNGNRFSTFGFNELVVDEQLQSDAERTVRA